MSENGSYDRIGPRKPKPAPTFPIVAAAAESRLERRQLETEPRGIDRDDDGAEREEADVGQDEESHRAHDPLVDHPGVEVKRAQDLGVDDLVELAARDLRGDEVADDLEGLSERRPFTAASTPA